MDILCRSSRSKLIMVVEDDRGVNDALEFLVVSENGRPLTVRAGSEYHAEVTLSDADCLVFDHYTPGLSGLRVLSRLRDLGIDIPTIFVTRGDDRQLRKKACELGAFAVLEQPFLEAELSGTIHRAIGRS